MRATPAIVAATVLSACSVSDPPHAEETAPSEPFELRVGEEAQTGEDLTVRFTAVVGDSRCPSDVTCIWGGDAEIEVAVTRGEEQRSLKLHTHGGDAYPRQAAAFGCSLELQKLEPYPVSTEDIEEEDYVATLQVKVGEIPENAI